MSDKTNFLFKQMPNTKGNGPSLHTPKHSGGATDSSRQGVMVDHRKTLCCDKSGNPTGNNGAGKVMVEKAKPLAMKNWKGSSSFTK